MANVKTAPHNNAVVSEQDAIERLFCKPFEQLQTHPCSNELGTMIFKLGAIKGSKREMPEIPESDKPQLLKIIEKRVTHCFDYTLDSETAIFLAVLSGTPGVAIMYLTYLQYWAFKNNEWKIDFGMFCTDIFPVGYPSEKSLHEIWESQKIMRVQGNKSSSGSDNLVDYASAMQSIRKPKSNESTEATTTT